jgi:aspartyl-tRNA(Asn)/glutamyl-tRNA(Gln) amidotransferase subunit C
MAVIDAAKVKHIAKLARIRVTQEEVTSYATELSSIMGLIEELNEVVDGEATAIASIVTHPLPMREDVVSDGFMVDFVLANAPKSSYGCFVVPKVIDQG